MEYQPPLHLGVVAIEKGAFESHSTKVDNFNNSKNISILMATLEIFYAFAISRNFRFVLSVQRKNFALIK